MVMLPVFDNAVRLAPEEISAKLTGYEHNGVTCIGLKTDIPVNILSTQYVTLQCHPSWAVRSLL